MKKADRIFLLMTGFSCNNFCVFCSNIADRDQNKSTDELFKNISKGYKDGYRRIEFIGGEPTIRKDFLKLVSFSKKVGFREIAITTNGRCFSYQSFAQKAIESGLSSINFSLHGCSASMHDGVTRAPGSFAQCVDGIKNVVGRATTTVNTVVSKVNRDHLIETGEFIHDLGVRVWVLLELLPDGHGAVHYHALASKYDELPVCFDGFDALAEKFSEIDVCDLPFCIFNRSVFSHRKMVFSSILSKRGQIDQYSAGGEAVRLEKKESGCYQDKYKIKPDFCSKCRHFLSCGGIARPYFEKHGDREIKKMAKKNACFL